MIERFARISRPMMLLLLVVCVGCSQDPVPRAKNRASPSPSASTTAPKHQGNAEHGAPAAPATPRDVRLTIEKYLGHHAVLMIRAMRASVDNEPRAVEAANKAVQRNTKELAGAVSSLYGASAGASFTQLWTEQIDALTAYSAAVAKVDRAGMAAAKNKLTAHAARYGETVEQLSEGRLAADEVESTMAEHTTRLTDGTDAYAANEFGTAFAGQRTAYATMFGIGKELAGAAVSRTSGQPPAEFDNPPAQLRSALGRLLGEHAVLATDLTRLVVSGKPGAESAAAALNNNNEDLLHALHAALGADAAKAFGHGWASHSDSLVDYAAAVADGDVEGQSRARAVLDRRNLRVLMAGLSGGKGTAHHAGNSGSGNSGKGGKGGKGGNRHRMHMLQQLTAYAANDFATSQELAYEGYNHMFSVAETLARTVESYTARTAPHGGAATGGGASASR